MQIIQVTYLVPTMLVFVAYELLQQITKHNQPNTKGGKDSYRFFYMSLRGLASRGNLPFFSLLRWGFAKLWRGALRSQDAKFVAWGREIY